MRPYRDAESALAGGGAELFNICDINQTVIEKNQATSR
jgi:hypothetical protein